MDNKKFSVGFLYGTEELAVKLAQRFAGHLINDKEFCKACELLEQKVKCDHCREKYPSFAGSIYFFNQVGNDVPVFIENPEEFLPKSLPPVDYVIVVGIHQDLLSGLPDYFKDKNVKAIIVPIEDPKWVPAGLQVQVLSEFEKYGIEAVFPKPFCSLSAEEYEYNKVGFHITKERKHIADFIEHFQIGLPKVSFLLSKDGKSIEDGCILRSAPCGSTYYIVQQLKGKYYQNGKETSLNEKISKSHHSFPCSASMDQDSTLKDSILHVGGYLVRNAVRRELGLEEQEGVKLKYVIK